MKSQIDGFKQWHICDPAADHLSQDFLGPARSASARVGIDQRRIGHRIGD